MKEISDKVAKTPSAYWAYYITGMSVLFSLIAFLVLFRISNDIQINLVKQTASNALEYRSDLLETNLRNQTQILRGFELDIQKILDSNPETYPEIITGLFPNKINLSTDHAPVGLILYGATSVEIPDDGILAQLRDHWKTTKPLDGYSIQIFSPSKLEDGRWFIYICKPVSGNKELAMVDTAVDISQIFQSIPFDTYGQNIRFQLMDKAGNLVIGNDFPEQDDTIKREFVFNEVNWVLSAAPSPSWKGMSSGYTNTIFLSILFILSIYNLTFFLILRKQQNLIAGIHKTAQEVINQAKKAYTIEAKLQKSDLVLSKATGYAHIGIWEYDLASKQTYWSEELFRILGQVPKDLPPGANYFIHLLSEEEYDLYREQATKVVRDKKPADLEVTIHSPGGEDIEIWMTIHPQLDEQGTVTGIWGLAQDITLIKTAEQELLVLNRALEMVLTCNQVIARSTEEQEMMEEVSKTITDIGGFPLAWIGEAMNDENKTVKILAKSGVIENYTETVKLRWDDSKMGTGPTGRSIKQNKTIISQDLMHDQSILWKDKIKQENLNSVISIPFELGAGRRALISIYSDRKDAFDSKEKQILVQLAHDLSSGVQAVRAQQEYQKILEELRSSQERSSRILEMTPNGIGLSDLVTGKFVEVNEGFCQISGYSREELIGKSAQELDIWTVKGDRSRFYDEINQNKQLTDYELEFRRKDGTVGFGILKARAIMMDHRELVLSVVTDLTEQRQIVEAHHIADERYQLMTENMSEVIWLISEEFIVTYVSAAVRSFLDYSPSHLVGKEWKTVFSPTSYQSLVEFISSIQKSKQKEAIPFLVDFITADHSLKSAEINFSKMVDGKSGEITWLCVARDITDRIAIEEALHESELRWQYALEGSGDGLWDWNLVDNSVYYSPRIYSMLNYDQTEKWSTVDDWSERVHPDDLGPIWNSIEEYISGVTSSYQAEFRMRCGDGTYKWLMDRGKIVAWDHNGKPTRLVGVHTDISETKQMVEALQKSESQFRLLAERSSDIISRISATGEILYTSPATEQVLGFTESELKNWHLIDLVHPEDRALVKFVVEHIKEYKEIQPLQYRIKDKSGKYIWTESTAKMILNSQTGEFEEVQLTTRDVSARVEAETALRESEEKLRALISQSVDGIVLISEEGKIIEWSKGQERMTGIPGTRAIGQYLWKIQFDSLPEEEKTEERKIWIQKQSVDFLSGGSYTPSKPIPSEWEIQHTDGSKLFIQSTVFPIHTAHGYMGGAISRDITDIKNAELARIKSEERLRFITDNMIDVVCFIDENFIIQYISPSVKGSLGYLPEEIQQKKLAQFIHPEDYEDFIYRIEECKRKKEYTFQTEYRILDSKQTYRWLESSVNLVFDDKNHYTGAVLGSRDISARKIVDDALRASENRYRTLARNFPNGMVMLFDQDTRFTVVDGVGLDLFGINREESEGKTLQEVFPPDLVEELESYFQSALNGEMEDFELSVGEYAIQFYTVPLHDEHGNITGGMMMTQNITDRKDAVVALSSRAQFLSSLNEITRIALETSDTSQLLQHITDLLVLLFEADDCYITRWDAQNQRTIPIAASGSTRETYKYQVASEDEITLTSSVLELERAIVVDDPFNSKYISNSIAKKFRSVSLLGLPLIGGGQKLGAAMIGYNHPHQFDDEEIQKAEQVAGQIALGLYKQKLLDEVRTYNQELEKRVQERTADLEEKNKELETFTYSVSHDLKAPLRGIDGYSRLLIEDHGSKLDPEALAFLQTIRQATTQMNQLIEDLLSYSRLERRTLTIANVDLKKLIGQIIQERKLDIEKKKIDIQLDIPDCIVKIDQKALEQALRNIMDNAIKFNAPNREQIISIQLLPEAGKYILKIQDNGIGFDMKYHDKIFDIFQRLHLSESYPGTGIGLALVKKAMQRVGGTAWATSEPGEGSTFYLEFPGEMTND